MEIAFVVEDLAVLLNPINEVNVVNAPFEGCCC